MAVDTSTSRPGTHRSSRNHSTRGSTARSTLSSRRQRVETGATNRPRKTKTVPRMTSAKAQVKEALTAHIGEWRRPPGSAAVDRSAAFRSRKVSDSSRDLQMATWGPTVVPRPKSWVSESQHQQNTLRDHEAIAAEIGDEFEVIEREKARKAVMMGEQNLRVTNRARARLAQLAVHKYGGVKQMFECLDRNNDKELSLDEFSHALKRRNLEKLFPREQQRIVYEALDRDFSDSVDAHEMIAWLEEDPRAALAAKQDISKLRASEDRNIGELTLPPCVNPRPLHRGDGVHALTLRPQAPPRSKRQDRGRGVQADAHYENRGGQPGPGRVPRERPAALGRDACR